MTSASNDAGPSRPRKLVTGRPKNSCERCKRRKIKCDSAVPSCAACIKFKADCSYPAGVQHDLEKTRIHKLEAKLRRLERQYVQQADKRPTPPTPPSILPVDYPTYDTANQKGNTFIGLNLPPEDPRYQLWRLPDTEEDSNVKFIDIEEPPDRPPSYIDRPALGQGAAGLETQLFPMAPAPSPRVPADTDTSKGRLFPVGEFTEEGAREKEELPPNTTEDVPTTDPAFHSVNGVNFWFHVGAGLGT